MLARALLQHQLKAKLCLVILLQLQTALRLEVLDGASLEVGEENGVSRRRGFRGMDGELRPSSWQGKGLTVCPSEEKWDWAYILMRSWAPTSGVYVGLLQKICFQLLIGVFHDLSIINIFHVTLLTRNYRS